MSNITMAFLYQLAIVFFSLLGKEICFVFGDVGTATSYDPPYTRKYSNSVGNDFTRKYKLWKFRVLN